MLLMERRDFYSSRMKSSLVLFSLIICLSVSRPVVPSVLTRAFGMKRSTLRQVAVFPSNDDLQCWRTVVVSFCRLRYIWWSLRGR